MLMRTNATGDGGLVSVSLDRARTANVADAAGAFDLRLFARLLAWHARLIAAVVLAAIAATIGLITTLPPKYTATAVVMLDPREPRVTTSETVLPGIGSDAAAVESQVELVQSPLLARKVIEALHLGQDPEFTSASIVDQAKNLLGLSSEETPELAASRLLDRFARKLTVSRRGLTYILEINYSSEDAKKAALIANTIAQTYIDDQQILRRDLTKDASVWLDERLEAMRERVRKSEQAIADYKASHHVVDVTRGDNLIARQIEDVSQQLTLAQARKAEVGGRLKQIQEARRQQDSAQALADVLQSQTMANLRAQYANAARIEAQYRSIYGNRHPFLIAAREQLDELRAQIDREVARVMVGLSDDYDAASKQESALAIELAALEEKSKGLEQANVPLAALTREADANRALFEQYLSRLKQVDQEQNLRFGDARVVAPAIAPLKPSRPSMILLILAAGACGFILGIGLALIAEQIRRGLRTADEVEQVFGLPCLGMMPELKRLDRRTGQRSGVGVREQWPTQASLEYARSLSAITTRLRRSAAGESEVLVVASALPGEGKSTFACNLALASASKGIQTLLIDGDHDAAEITRMFDLAGPGLNELCLGKADLWNVAAHDVASGLYVVGTGETDASNTCTVEEKVSDLLDEYRQFFKLIVIDTPAILPTGGGCLVECSDRVALIVEWNGTDRTAVWESLDMLTPHDRKVVGIVLNKTSMYWYDLSAQGQYLRDQYSAGFSSLVFPNRDHTPTLIVLPSREGSPRMRPPAPNG
jgi:succinoglycan biosynthesis transport protein ExoP